MFNKIKRWWKRPKNPTGHVYYARLRTQQGTFYKVGYTSKPTLVHRMAFGQHGDEKLIDREFFFTFREDAWDVEQTLLDHFDKHRAFGKFSNDPRLPLAGRGQSELFAHDILGLDEDLYKLSHEASIAAQGELKKAGDGCLFVLLGLLLAPFTLGLSLLFILGGGMDVFEYGKSAKPAVKHPQRPQHPRMIQELLSALTQRRHA